MQPQVIGADHRMIDEQHEAADEVLELPDVARPRIALEERERLGRQPLDGARSVLGGERSEELGQILDPIADKLLTSAAFISLVQLNLAPAWMVAIIIGREFAITALRSLAYSRGVTIPASPLGKIKMGSQVTAILLLIVGWGPIPALAPLGYAALWVVMTAAMVSAVDYYRRFQRLVNARVTDVNIVRERRQAERRTANLER